MSSDTTVAKSRLAVITFKLAKSLTPGEAFDTTLYCTRRLADHYEYDAAPDAFTVLTGLFYWSPQHRYGNWPEIANVLNTVIRALPVPDGIMPLYFRVGSAPELFDMERMQTYWVEWYGRMGGRKS